MRKIEIDDREKPTKLDSLLEVDPYWQVEWKRMKSGDYRLEGGILVKRKTWSDLVISLIEGRLFDQANQHCGVQQTLFLLERDDAFFHRKIRKERIQGD